MKLHILTALTRPENLSDMGRSIFDDHHDGWEIIWHLTHKNEKHVGGQFLKNLLLDEVADGWVYFLDDDTVLHHEFQATTYETIMDYPSAVAVLFAQNRSEGVIQPQITRGHIDIGQALILREQIGDVRIPEEYDGDGWFITAVLGNTDVVLLEDVLSHYNALRKERDGARS
jgi:hypothetical protein